MRIALFSAGVVGRKGYARNLCLARGLVRQGNQITLFICNDKLRFEKRVVDGVELVLLPKLMPYRIAKGGIDPLDTLARMGYIAFKSYDLVHADVGFRPAAGWPGHWLRWRRHIPYVCDWWDWVGYGGMLDGRSRLYQLSLGAWDNYFEEWDKRHADGIVTISRCLQNRAVKLGIPIEKTCVMHGGADIWTRTYLAPTEARREVGLPLDGFIVGFAGMGPHEYRSLLPFLEAVPALRDSIPGFRWFSTGDRIPEHVKRQFNIGDEYFDLGWVDYSKYGLYLASANVLLQLLSDTPNSRARWPNKMGDYLAAGRPIVGTYVGELAEFAKQYPMGFVSVDWKADTVIEKLTHLANNKPLCREMGNYNLGVAIEAYSWDEKARQLNSFYQRILNQR